MKASRIVWDQIGKSPKVIGCARWLLTTRLLLETMCWRISNTNDCPGARTYDWTWYFWTSPPAFMLGVICQLYIIWCFDIVSVWDGAIEKSEMQGRWLGYAFGEGSGHVNVYIDIARHLYRAQRERRKEERWIYASENTRLSWLLNGQEE